MTQNTQTTAEKMANLAHEIWARWMRYMFTKCIFQTDGGILIPGKMAERWTRQMETRYPDLPESEKQSDRDIANEYMFCAEIDALTRERDEARAELAGLDAGMRFQFDRAEDYKAQRDEARAEVERLTIPANAWAAWQTDYAIRPAAEGQTLKARVADIIGDAVGMHEGDYRIACDAIVEWIERLMAEVERLRPAAWSQVFELQAKHAATWRDRDESYWLARFMEEVGELAGALVGNHVGPVEWELTQLAAIALNWLDMRAARARAAKEAKP